MTEGCASRYLKGLAVLAKPCLEFFACRLAQVGQIVSEKIHLLGHPAFDDRVFLVQAQFKRFAVEHFLANFVIEQTLDLVRCRCGAPLRLPHQADLIEVVCC